MSAKGWVDKWTDFGLSDRTLDFIREEDIRQLEKWGEQTHTPAEWLMFMTEESGELAEAIAEWWFRDGTLEDVQKEAVQVATLAIKIAYMAGDTIPCETE